jgi:SAM-dependent methyltransferase
MTVLTGISNLRRRLIQSYGSEKIKSRLWDHEFAGGRWDCLDSTVGDCVYPFLEKHANRGSILDLGCGSASTVCELDPNAYRDYIGVDISDVALRKARTRAEQSGRKNRSSFFRAEIFDYTPTQPFNVILFRDSI